MSADGLQVYIEVTPDVNMYVRSYGGWMTSMSDRRNADLLANDLKKMGAMFQEDVHYAAGYNRCFSR